ncbi:MAG: bifunctional phosphoglucose/phosphomannose isomerase [Brumimicrobium sp.]|nr:bifunctional phosphoglucose/phosphomannose isomerase [Brumimicrobium sp.]
MDKLVAQFPKHISDAIEIANEASLEGCKQNKYSNVVICGMGGSGIGGKMVSQWFTSEAKTPVIVVQSYHLPGFVNENSLVIGSSYSGNTEETLAAIYKAKEKGATIVGITSGGELAKFCKENSYDCIKVPGGNPPRSMLAFSVIQLIKVLSVCGIIPENSLSQIDRCRHLLNNELITIKDEAKKLAEFIKDKLCVIYANTSLESVAVRARQQFNENSKQLCWHHVFPEMNHNELVGWEGGNAEYAAIFLISNYLTDRNKLRAQLSQEIIGNKTPHLMVIQGKGKSIIEESFYFIHIVDWASVFLADLKNVDPVDIKVIDYLKDSLSKK